MSKERVVPTGLATTEPPMLVGRLTVARSESKTAEERLWNWLTEQEQMKRAGNTYALSPPAIYAYVTRYWEAKKK